jgi:hypothetical protein
MKFINPKFIRRGYYTDYDYEFNIEEFLKKLDLTPKLLAEALSRLDINSELLIEALIDFRNTLLLEDLSSDIKNIQLFIKVCYNDSDSESNKES